MSDPTDPKTADNSIRVGDVRAERSTVVIGSHARGMNVHVAGISTTPGNTPTPPAPWWRQLDWRRLMFGAVLAVVAFGVSLWLWPEGWGESSRPTAALIVAVVVGVTVFLDAARNAYLK